MTGLSDVHFCRSVEGLLRKVFRNTSCYANCAHCCIDSETLHGHWHCRRRAGTRWLASSRRKNGNWAAKLPADSTLAVKYSRAPMCHLRQGTLRWSAIRQPSAQERPHASRTVALVRLARSRHQQLVYQCRTDSPQRTPPRCPDTSQSNRPPQSSTVGRSRGYVRFQGYLTRERVPITRKSRHLVERLDPHGQKHTVRVVTSRAGRLSPIQDCFLPSWWAFRHSRQLAGPMSVDVLEVDVALLTVRQREDRAQDGACRSDFHDLDVIERR